jgi:N-methylhydantoinase A/oxoprolinase/acetone carboxylase beta subunit
VIVCVTGGRTFTDTAWLHAGLDLLHSMAPISKIIEGGAPGADVRAGEWSRRRLGKEPTVVEAEWEKHSKGLKHGQKNPAGMIRNNDMAKMRPDVVLATPGGAGTAHMVGVSKKLGLRVIFLEKMPVLKSPAGPTLDGALP